MFQLNLIVNDLGTNKNNDQVFIQDIYKMDEDSEMHYTARYGVWDSKRGISVFETSISKRRSDLQGHEFK